MKRTTIITLLFLLLFGNLFGAEKIIIAADAWMPFNGEPGSSKPGYMIEIAEKIFTGAGYDFEYKILPWSRAIKEAELGNINGIIGAFYNDAPNFVFPAEELAIVQNGFFVLKGTNWKYTGNQSLLTINLGLITDYSYGEELDTFFKNNKEKGYFQFNYGENPLEKNINKLLSKRIDVILESTSVFLYKTNEMGISHKIKAAGKVEGSEKAYIAFSPTNRHSQTYARILSEGIAELRKSGELKIILQKYGLKDWK